MQGAYSSWQQYPEKLSITFCTLILTTALKLVFPEACLFNFSSTLCAAPCHSNKFLFYHWVSLSNFCCLPPKSPGKDSGIWTTVWLVELVGQQPPSLAKEPLRLTSEERGTLSSNRFRAVSAHVWTLARKLIWQLPKKDWGMWELSYWVIIAYHQIVRHFLFCVHLVWVPAQVKSRLTRSLYKRNGSYRNIIPSQKM